MSEKGKNYSTKVLSTLSSSELLKMYSLSYMKSKKDTAEKSDSVYGREIMTDIKSKRLPWTPSHSTLYPILKKLVETDALKVVNIEGDRIYYEITNIGEEYLQNIGPDFIEGLRKTSKFYDDMANELAMLSGIKEEDTKEEEGEDK